MAASSPEVRETLDQLRRTPEHFERCAHGVSDAHLRRHPDERSWSVHEVLAHLRGAADVQGGWIARMLARDTPAIRYASPRTGMRKTGYESQQFGPFLQAFANQRAELIETLDALSPADWSRRASFTGTKAGWSPSVFDVARAIAAHELAHFDQIAEAAAANRST